MLQLVQFGSREDFKLGETQIPDVRLRQDFSETGLSLSQFRCERE